MIFPSKLEREVDGWKRAVYKQIKNMTPEQKSNYYGKELEDKLEKLGFRYKPIVNLDGTVGQTLERIPPS